jgi:hypothetical protein
MEFGGSIQTCTEADTLPKQFGVSLNDLERLLSRSTSSSVFSVSRPTGAFGDNFKSESKVVRQTTRLLLSTMFLALCHGGHPHGLAQRPSLVLPRYIRKSGDYSMVALCLMISEVLNP